MLPEIPFANGFFWRRVIYEDFKGCLEWKASSVRQTGRGDQNDNNPHERDESMKTWVETLKKGLLVLAMASLAAMSLTGCVVRDDHDHDHDHEHEHWEHDHWEHDHP